MSVMISRCLYITSTHQDRLRQRHLCLQTQWRSIYHLYLESTVSCSIQFLAEQSLHSSYWQALECQVRLRRQQKVICSYICLFRWWGWRTDSAPFTESLLSIWHLNSGIPIMQYDAQMSSNGYRWQPIVAFTVQTKFKFQSAAPSPGHLQIQSPVAIPIMLP